MSAPQLTQYVQGETILSGDGLNTFEQTCDTFNDLRAFVGTTGMQVFSRGGNAIGDGLQGPFYWNSFGSGIDDNVNNIVPAGGGGQWTRDPVSFVGTIMSGLSIGTAAGDLVQLNSSGALPAVSGANLTNLPTPTNTASPVVGDARNAFMTVTTASASAVFTADQVIVGTSLSGSSSNLPSYNQPLNLTTTGPGGMDSGSAPLSGYVSIYAISGVSGASILASNTTTSQATIYGGGNMPTGYTSSALISVWPTDGSGLLVAGMQQSRTVYIRPTTVLSTSTQQASLTLLSVASAVPPNSKTVGGYFGAQGTVPGANVAVTLAPGNSTVGQQYNTEFNGFFTQFKIPMSSPQSVYYQCVLSSGSLTSLIIYATNYDF